MSVKCILGSIKAIRAFRPDILYAPGPAALPWSAVCGTLMKKPVVWHLHHIFLDGPTKKLLNICSQWKAVKHIIAISHCVGEQITADSSRDKVEVVYNPVDVVHYSGGDGRRFLASAEKQHGISLGNRFLIGHIALILRAKQQSFVLSLVRALRNRGIDAVGVFAGEIRERDYEEELLLQIQTHGLENAAVLLGRRDDIPDMLKAMSVVVIPSLEGFTLAGMEAAAAGTPVAACDTAGAQEFIDVSQAGVIFREKDISSAVDAVLTVIEQSEQFRKNGYAFAERASLTEYDKRLKAVFDTVRL
jgi:glycosyltransferase involved in cell wall biosynthesis